jgi:hypothetical protein
VEQALRARRHHEPDKNDAPTKKVQHDLPPRLSMKMVVPISNLQNLA